MAGCIMDEEEIWKCTTHPSKRRRTGICPICLRDRLNTLCPNCAHVRPCECCPLAAAAASSSSASSSSSSFSLFSSTSTSGEPSMRRSRSLAIPFLRSRSKYAPNLEFIDQKPPPPPPSQPPVKAPDQSLPLPLPPPPANDQKPPLPGKSGKSKTASLLSMFKTNKSKKLGEIIEKEKEEELNKTSSDFAWMMRRSRSVAVPKSLNSRAAESDSAGKTRGWHFPSPMNAFRQSKASKVLEEHPQSTMCKV
ncbi:hypothetical protein DCAR_0209345 [Daucus carota subsp. sativus]|uniref:Uncharacterized protein n=1 Tax=Daucus carota subsp. sativus TaxID=79200 RepID=A0A166F7C7_DAUCS|nr:PREDICTED: probable inactive serine/threonine-protein kinase slob2 [Daucus carota subsp. sativus]WOG90104.1 hypothetical protein DCAR_0209345 [Daucus carota subsp. sativus]